MSFECDLQYLLTKWVSFAIYSKNIAICFEIFGTSVLSRTRGAGSLAQIYLLIYRYRGGKIKLLWSGNSLHYKKWHFEPSKYIYVQLYK